jgi:hypothetical protein
MGLKGSDNDPRLFQHFAKLNPDGSVAAIVEVADTDAEAYKDTRGTLFVNVTDLYPYDFAGVKVLALPLDPMLAKQAARTQLATLNKVPRNE